MAEKKSESSEMLAVVLVRGRVGTSYKVKTTLDSLKLFRKNNCVVIPKTSAYLGMLQAVKSYITWGEVDTEMLKLLKNVNVVNGVYKLHPPIKGFERKGIKKDYSIGGALGYRKDKIVSLIKRMI